MKRKQATFAEEWQLAVLKKLHSESETPTEEQRAAAVAETGLDHKWVRNWFARQRLKSRAAPRDGRNPVVSSDYEAHSVNLSPKILPTFRLQVASANSEPQQPPRILPSYRSASTPFDPVGPPGIYPPPPSRASVRSHSPRPSRSVPNPQDSCQRRVSSPTNPSDPSPNKTPPLRATLVTTYFRDPLANRYPDFSQFFHPLVYQRFRDSGLEVPVNGHNLLMQLLVNADMDPHAPAHLKGLFDPRHLSAIQVDPPSSTCARPCPIAFSVRLADLIQ